MVGHNFLATMAESDHTSEFELITFSEEPRLAYDRVQLSKYFSGATAADLILTTESEYDDCYLKNEKVVEIDADNKTITTSTGRIEGYDNGSGNRLLPICSTDSGKDQEHHLVRTIEDLEAISASAEVSKLVLFVAACSFRSA